MPREAECCGVLLRAPPGPGALSYPLALVWGGRVLPDSVSLPDLLLRTFLPSHEDQPVMSMTPAQEWVAGGRGLSEFCLLPSPGRWKSSCVRSHPGCALPALSLWPLLSTGHDPISRSESGRVSRRHPVSLAMTLSLSRMRC